VEEEEEEAEEEAAAAEEEEAEEEAEEEEEEAGTWYRDRERSRLRPLYRFSLSRPLSLPPSLSEPPGGLAPVLKKLGSVKLKLAKTSLSRARAVDGVTPSASSSSFFNGSSISHSCVYYFYNQCYLIIIHNSFHQLYIFSRIHFICCPPSRIPVCI
jgi:hypothetical protein